MNQWLRKWGFSTVSLIACVAIGVVLGLGGYTFHYGQGTSYFSNDPTACVNCHIMREHYDGWQKASHHAVAKCNDCHLPHDLVGKYLAKAENGFFHSKGFTLQDFHEPIRIHKKNALIVHNNCIDCHKELVSEQLRYGAFDDLSNYCVRCHQSVGHGPCK